VVISSELTFFLEVVSQGVICADFNGESVARLTAKDISTGPLSCSPHEASHETSRRQKSNRANGSAIPPSSRSTTYTPSTSSPFFPYTLSRIHSHHRFLRFRTVVPPMGSRANSSRLTLPGSSCPSFLPVTPHWSGYKGSSSRRRARRFVSSRKTGPFGSYRKKARSSVYRFQLTRPHRRLRLRVQRAGRLHPPGHPNLKA